MTTPDAVTGFCDRCGEPGTHEECRAARALEPPRYCAQCRRRMKVQVLPTGWSASCVEHGAVTQEGYEAARSVAP